MAEQIYARKTKVKDVSSEEAKVFLEENHRQGNAQAKGKRSWGLYSDDQLIAVMQVSNPRTAAMKRKYTKEILRLAFKKDVRVVGGASKLIKYVLRNYSPAAIFTYQDMSGEQTNIYQEGGMSLAKTSKTKEYLVAPGKTLETAKKKEYFSMGEVVRHGPDRLLGTNLGEIYRKSGKRKTNPELFIEELGWHIEETPGDRVWEWFNPNYSFYTYKITASDSDKYYYGVKQIPISFKNVTKKDCLNDNYWGSGTRKFKFWKIKHEGHLEKEVIKIFNRKHLAYAHEKKLIGELWKTDKLCLNSRDGGRSIHVATPEYEIIKCEIHGKTKHRKNVCLKCSAALFIKEAECPTHGLTVHFSSVCFKCSAKKRYNEKACAVHGFTTHQGESCLKCSNAKAYQEKDCEIHGRTLFRKDKCQICINKKPLKMKECKHHGFVVHQGNTCTHCNAKKSVSKKECPIHGLVTHQGDTCNTCVIERGFEEKECEIHGLSKHYYDKCRKCLNEKTVSKKECPIHGLVTHQGNTCNTCLSARGFEEKECEIHGLTKHFYNKCRKCQNTKTLTIKTCPTHGETKHQGNTCNKCMSAKVITVKTCAIHGETKHKKEKCAKCSSEKTAHTRWHQTQKKADCVWCQNEISATE